MMLLRFLNPQGIAGLIAATVLALLLIGAKIDARHWKKQSARHAQLWEAEKSAHRDSELNHRRAADQARAADRANAARVASAQTAITERTVHDFEARIARARADAVRLRQPAQSGADPRVGRGAPVPGLSVAATGAAQAAAQDRLPDALIATEQAIQLDELIRWVKAQAAIDPNQPPPAE